MGRFLPVVMILLAGTVATAQPKSEGTRLFEEGRDLAKDGKFAEACEAFQKSYAIDRAAGTALNYGDCLEHLGQLRKAWQMYDEAAREFEKLGDARGKFARDRATAVNPKLGTLTIKVAEPKLSGLVIKIANESVPPQSQMVERYEPGTVAISASAPGRVPFNTNARSVAGTNVIVEIPALGEPGSGSGTGTGPIGGPGPEHPSTGSRNKSRVKLAIGVGAVGGAALITSGILALSARSKYNGALDDMLCVHQGGDLVCNQAGADQVDSAATRANLATGFAIGGGALAITGVVLFLTAPRESLQVTPMASSSTVGLVIGRSF